MKILDNLNCIFRETVKCFVKVKVTLMSTNLSFHKLKTVPTKMANTSFLYLGGRSFEASRST